MSDACVIAAGMVSAFGFGPDACRAPGTRAGQVAESAIAHDAQLAAAGLVKPYLARAPGELGVPASSDRASDLLLVALRQVVAELDDTLPAWRERRLGVALGTSSGGMIEAERFFEARASDQAPDSATAHGATYFAPLHDALARAGITTAAGGASSGSAAVSVVKLTQVLAACASATIAIGLGSRWLERGACDLVLAGGYDAVSLFVAAGFEAVRATSAGTPRPFRVGRDGMNLGEGAGVVALVRDGEQGGARSRGWVAGFGASDDAVHITAPDREGSGLIRAATAALADASCRPDQIDLVSAHGTATPHNDAMEARAINTVCPHRPVVHPFKAQIGHTLGAAGLLESLAAVEAMRRAVAPAAIGNGPVDPDAEVTLLERAQEQPLASTLKLSAAFAGVAAALVWRTGPSGRKPRERRAVVAAAYAHIVDVDRPALCKATGMRRLGRLDDLGLLALAATAGLVEQVGRERIEGAGVVMGHGLATLDTNERFNVRLVQRGARLADPRMFPATSPNAPPGHCAIAFGLTGPNFATGAGLRGSLEALVAAAELVAAGDAERMIVVAADDAGPAARHWVELTGQSSRPLERGGVAVLLEPHSGARQPPGQLVDLDMAIEHDAGPIGHLALLEWLARSASAI